MAVTTNVVDEVVSNFRRGPAHRYIRRTDHLPTYAQLGERGSCSSFSEMRIRIAELAKAAGF